MLDAQSQAWLDQEDAHVADLIRRHGWFIQYVYAAPEKQPRPGTFRA